MSWGTLPSGEPLDLTTCDREPIHVPGSIQPHGVLLALHEPGLRVAIASANAAALLGVAIDSLIGAELAELIDDASLSRVRAACADEGGRLEDHSPLRVAPRRLPAAQLDAILHRSGGLLIVELEPSSGTALAIAAYRAARRAVDQVDRAATVLDLAARATREVRQLTGFDRVMVYRFDEDWNGEVIAEDKREDLEPFFGLHYPAADIPAQARRLYALNTLRIIPDVRYAPAPLVPQLNPLSGEPLDLSGATLRSVSPVHCEYLSNMGVRGSMSISLLRDGKLWGLIACHHYSPRFVPYEVRISSEFLGRSLSWQIAAREHADAAESRAHAQSQLQPLVARLGARSDLFEALADCGLGFAALVGAAGLALVDSRRTVAAGATPSAEQIAELGRFLIGKPDVYESDRLSQQLPAAEAYRDVASGLLALALGPELRMLFFRPQVERTVRWGRDPEKAAVMAAGAAPRLSPLGSFGEWKQIVQGRSLPWQPWQLGIATDVRGALVGTVLRHAEERERLLDALARSNADLDQFAYVASHDLKAPLRGIANLSQWIEEDLSDRLEGEARENMTLLRGRVTRLEGLIEGILSYSRAGKQRNKPEQVDVAELLADAIELLAAPAEVAIHVHPPMPKLMVERVPFEQVFMNLVNNAIKHARRPNVRIDIRCEDAGPSWRFSVRDDGPGIAPEFQKRIWGIFQTLEGRDQVEGTGIGLSIVQKTAESRGGRVWVESQLGAGATFFVEWPKAPQKQE